MAPQSTSRGVAQRRWTWSRQAAGSSPRFSKYRLYEIISASQVFVLKYHSDQPPNHTGKKTDMAVHFLDQFSIELLFLLTVLLMLFMLEVGYRFGRSEQTKKAKSQTAQVRALMGATLGLLAFMMAFTFATAQTHYENRIQLQIDEAILAKNAFMQADLAQEPFRSQARDLLLQYVEGRLQLRKMVSEKSEHGVFEVITRANEIQQELWSVGKKAHLPSQSMTGESTGSSDMSTSVLGLMNMQTQRLQAALINRIPVVIWLTLYFTAVMSMIVVGYQAGLTEKRSPIATFSLALAFSAVMILIMDLDRPLQSMFQIDVTVMEQLAAFMQKHLE